MAEPHAPLISLEQKHDFLIAIDSDGCVFDSMEIKQKECFAPNTIKHWNLQPVSKFARAASEFVNLYSKFLIHQTAGQLCNLIFFNCTDMHKLIGIIPFMIEKPGFWIEVFSFIHGYADTLVNLFGIGYEDLRAQITNARIRASDIIVTAYDTDNSQTNKQFSIKSVFPNPFNPATTISIYLPDSEYVTVEVYDILGRHVETVFQGLLPAGERNLIFDGKKLASGLYFVRLLTAGGFSTVEKITVLK